MELMIDEEKKPDAADIIADEMRIDNANDPWTLADKEGKKLLTPMDNKTIKNAIQKRIPQARRIQLVRKGNLGAMAIVVVCQADYPGEQAAILVENDANIFIRHAELMNIVDEMWSELQKRKRLHKTNQLPSGFLRSENGIALGNHAK